MRYCLLLTALASGCALFGAGKSALETDPSGWIDLTPPATLEGWTRIPVPPTDGLKPPNQWSVRDGVVICTGKGQHEWLRSNAEYADFILHVEWKAEARDGNYNSGIGVRMSPWVEIWHQAQTTPKGGYLFGNTFTGGAIQRVSLAKEMKDNRLKPAGEWNTYEIRCEGGAMTLWVNGAVANTWKDNQVRRGHLGLEAEGYEIHFRNLRLKQLP